MTPEQFCYWLQSYVELSQGNIPTPEQWKSIEEHLNTVFVKVTNPNPIPNFTHPLDKGMFGKEGGVLPSIVC